MLKIRGFFSKRRQERRAKFEAELPKVEARIEKYRQILREYTVILQKGGPEFEATIANIYDTEECLAINETRRDYLRKKLGLPSSLEVSDVGYPER
jgi:hypothetical protein